MPRRVNGVLAPAPAPPHIIHPNAVYTIDQARRALCLRETTIRREVREGRLRIAKCAKRRYILGEWLLEWVRAGELKRTAGAPPHPGG